MYHRPAATNGNAAGSGADVYLRPVRVIISSRDLLVRNGARFILEQQPGIRVQGEATGLKETYELALRSRPDVLVLGLGAVNRAHLDALPHFAAVCRVIVLMSRVDEDLEFEAVRRGASAVLRRDVLDPQNLRATVRGDASPPDNLYELPSRTVSGKMAQRTGGCTQASRSPAATTPQRSAESLSPREVEVMELIARGFRNGDIAQTLQVSEKTVKNHINRVFAKLQVDTRARAILIWLGYGGASPGTTG